MGAVTLERQFTKPLQSLFTKMAWWVWLQIQSNLRGLPQNAPDLSGRCGYGPFLMV
jgi:hypothetical protein